MDDCFISSNLELDAQKCCMHIDVARHQLHQHGSGATWFWSARWSLVELMDMQPLKSSLVDDEKPVTSDDFYEMP